ncbi:hypothetical protein [Psychrobacter sp.]|uniref:hypothetical protein n=1 Tax=Psychrobacter sp. TaxID=56811 RepID=UPI002FD9C29C
MLEIFGEKLSVNLRTVSAVIAITAFSLLTGCQTLPNTMPKANHATKTPIDTSASNLLTARMPAIDRQGRIAYVEEQGSGAAKISTLYSIRPDGSDRQLIYLCAGVVCRWSNARL